MKSLYERPEDFQFGAHWSDRGPSWIVRILRGLLGALGLLLVSVASAAPMNVGTKADGLGMGGGAPQPPIFQTLLALGAVAVLLKWVLPKVIGWMTGKTAGPDGAGIRVEATAPAGAATLHIVQAGGKRLLIGVSGSAISTLAELDETEVEAPFLEQLDRAVVQLDQQPSQPAPRRAVAMTQEDAERALRRLRRIAG